MKMFRFILIVAIFASASHAALAKTSSAPGETPAGKPEVADQNLPQMVWYALEPLAAADTAKALRLAATSKLPNLREFVARRAASK